MSNTKSIVTKLGLVIAVFIVGYGLAEIPNYLRTSQTSIDTDSLCLVTSEVCMLEQTSIVISQDVVKAMQPTAMSVVWPGSDEDTLLVSLTGVEMEMGEPRFVLNRSEGDTFSGELLLPVCTSDAMTWIGNISNGQNSHNFKLNMER